MIYTSYFANQRNFPDNFEAISIARITPSWFTGKHIASLMPSLSLLQKWKKSNQDAAAQDEYEKIYRKQLESKDAKLLEKLLMQYCGNKIPVLLCYEKDGFCHRHIVAKWFKENGVECKEF